MKIKNKNIWIFLPDGVGLRNFVYGNIYKLSIEKGISLTYWNNTTYSLNENLGLKEVKIENAKNHFLSDLYKRAKKEIELNLSFKKTKNPAYLSYSFPSTNKNLKSFVKNVIVYFFILKYNSQKGLRKISQNITRLERKTTYYKNSLAQLKEEMPAMVFCTNQRPMLGVAPILAAKDLNIPTVTFIFSWDNLPKGMLLIEADYYLVWSAHMKEELMYYYPHIKKEQVYVTGSPQFEMHKDSALHIDKEDFFQVNNLEKNKKYICFSGDDITTSPFDQYYLEDVAATVQELNKEGYNIGVIYRKCPVDFTDRHLEVVTKYKEIITCIDPKWANLGNGWDTVMPLKEDMQLLFNTIKHSELVINVGSSMAFDAVSHDKPCAYINYNTKKGDITIWNIDKIYKYIHFQSMPSKDAILWIDKKEDIKRIILDAIDGNYSLDKTKDWFDKICIAPQKDASVNIIETFKYIIK